MSYEGRHWGCGHNRKECDGNCQPINKIMDCPVCGSDIMCCPCGPDEEVVL